MTLTTLCAVLLACTLINLAMLLLWAGLIVFASGWLYRLHHHFFPMEQSQFIEINYCLMGFFKLIILVFNAVPLLALWIVR